MTVAKSSVNVEWIYEPFFKSECNEFLEYVIKNNFFTERGLKTYLKTCFGFLMKYNPLYKRQYIS